MGSWKMVRSINWEEVCPQTEARGHGPQSCGILRKVVVTVAII